MGVALVLALRAAPVPLLGLVSLALLAAATPVAAAWLTSRLLDGLAGPGSSWAARSWPTLAPVAIALVAVGLVGATGPHGTLYLQGVLARRASLAAQDRLYQAVNAFAGLGRFEDPAFLDRLRLAQQAGQGTPGQITLAGLGLLQASVTAIGFFGSLVLIHPAMAWVVLLGAVPALAGELRLARARVHTSVRTTTIERRETFYAMLLADVQAAKEIRLFGTGHHLRARMRADRRAADRMYARLDRRTLLTQGGLTALSAAVAAGGLLWAVRSAAAGGLTVGELTLFVAAVGAVQGSLASLAAGVALCHQHLLVFGHFLAVTTAGPDLPAWGSARVAEPSRPGGSAARPHRLPPLRHGIELRDVWFRYADGHPWVLRGVTMTIPCGRSVGLVGVNGAGKSTLVKLLCRFYDPTSGTITWDGVDIRQVPVDALRERISAIFQDFMEYDLTATENIALGDLAAGADPAAVRAAAARAGVDRTLAGLPKGYDTMLSRSFAGEDGADDDGVVLSGGQWQRVALGRTLLRDGRDLTILDEPSSGLDAEAEHEIHTQLREYRAGRTSLLISHRLGAVRAADLIVVLRDGAVVERGAHADLIGLDGHYAHLFRLQAGSYLPDGDLQTAGAQG
jgi:ATP-binding cassette subfamily B protein